MNTVSMVEGGLPRLVVVERVVVATAIGVLGIWEAIQSKLSLDVPAGDTGARSAEKSEMWITNVDVKVVDGELVHQSYVECWTGVKPVEAPLEGGSITILNIPGENGVLFKTRVDPSVCMDAEHPEADGAFVQVVQLLAAGK